MQVTGSPPSELASTGTVEEGIHAPGRGETMVTIGSTVSTLKPLVAGAETLPQVSVQIAETVCGPSTTPPKPMLQNCSGPPSRLSSQVPEQVMLVATVEELTQLPAAGAVINGAAGGVTSMFTLTVSNSEVLPQLSSASAA